MIELEIKNDRITPALERLGAVLSDMTPVMNDIGNHMIVSTKDRFEAGTAPDGSHWSPKSLVTMAAYRRSGDRPDPRPLHGPSGALAGNIFHQADRDQVAWGSPEIYAGTMQFGAGQGAFGRTKRGGPIPWGDIPARPFLGLSADDEDAIIRITARWLEGETAIA